LILTLKIENKEKVWYPHWPELTDVSVGKKTYPKTLLSKNSTEYSSIMRKIKI
jgi:hypothetical protein